MWALDTPFDLLVWVAWQALAALFAFVMLVSGNVLELGWPWLVCYWVALWLLVEVGYNGSLATVSVRKGNDVWEFDPTRRGAAWLGPIGWWLTNKVRLQASLAVLAEVGGYGGAIVLLAIGALWRWWLVIVAAWVLARAARWRRARVYRRRFAVP